MSDPRVDAILAQFPGPVLLHSSRKKWLLVLIGSLMFVAAGIWMAAAGEAWGWVGLIFFAIGAVIAALMLLPGAGALLIDGEGFEETRLFRKRRFRWQNVSKSKLAIVGLNSLVVYDEIGRPVGFWRRANAVFTGRNAWMADTYGFSASALAELMARWRERALSRSSS